MPGSRQTCTLNPLSYLCNQEQSNSLCLKQLALAFLSWTWGLFVLQHLGGRGRRRGFFLSPPCLFAGGIELLPPAGVRSGAYVAEEYLFPSKIDRQSVGALGSRWFIFFFI